MKIFGTGNTGQGRALRGSTVKAVTWRGRTGNDGVEHGMTGQDRLGKTGQDGKGKDRTGHDRAG